MDHAPWLAEVDQKKARADSNGDVAIRWAHWHLARRVDSAAAWNALGYELLEEFRNDYEGIVALASALAMRLVAPEPDLPVVVQPRVVNFWPGGPGAAGITSSGGVA